MEQYKKQTTHLNTWLNKRPARVTTVLLEPYNTLQLCRLYKCSYKTFIKRIRPYKHELGERSGQTYSVFQVEIIFARLGPPYLIREESEL